MNENFLTELVMPRWALIFTIAMFVICLFFVWMMASVFTANKIWEELNRQKQRPKRKRKRRMNSANDDIIDQP